MKWNHWDLIKPEVTQREQKYTWGKRCLVSTQSIPHLVLQKCCEDFWLYDTTPPCALMQPPQPCKGLLSAGSCTQTRAHMLVMRERLGSCSTVSCCTIPFKAKREVWMLIPRAELQSAEYNKSKTPRVVVRSTKTKCLKIQVDVGRLVSLPLTVCRKCNIASIWNHLYSHNNNSLTHRLVKTHSPQNNR